LTQSTEWGDPDQVLQHGEPFPSSAEREHGRRLVDVSQVRLAVRTEAHRRGICEQGAEGLALARHIAVVDPGLMRQTKRAINQACEARSMAEALDAALAIDLEIEGAGSPDKIAFMEVARREGLRAAIAWRDARFAKGV